MKKTEQRTGYACLPDCLPTGIDLVPKLLGVRIAFNLSESFLLARTFTILIVRC